ncbi:MAG TPA: hypothetical protein VMQ44_00315 [Candidatus Saccharimonadales bacterium]|nr:hypothetical protein [Candidatus Saccharimonadales bacterium]
MSRLPTPGGDDGTWGSVLNDYLSVAHNADGSLKTISFDEVGAAQGLTTTGIKTSGYGASAGDFIPVDTTSGSVTITLPSAPANGSCIGVKHIIQGSTNTVTIATGGSDFFNKAGGSTSLTLSLLNQGVLLQYGATANVWYVQADDLSLSQLDGRYSPIVYSSGWPARPSGSLLAAGKARYIGPYSAAPTDALAGDSWIPTRVTRNVIWSTDFYTDVDDVLASRVLAYHIGQGDVNLLAAVVDTYGPQTSAVALDGLLQSHGINVPIGQVNSTYSDLNTGGSYQANMAKNLPHRDLTTVPDAVTVMRTALANSATPADIICTGYQSGIQALLASSADSISSLTGTQLVAAKVNHVWMMGGQYPSGTENNFSRGAKEIAAAVAVVNSWPSSIPLTFLGHEVGTSVVSGDNFATSLQPHDPLRRALIDYGSYPSGRSSWDPMTMRLACLNDPTLAGYTTVAGTNNVNASTGANTFTTGSGNQFYVVKNKSDAAFVAELDSLYVPGAQPTQVRGEQIWSGGAWIPLSPNDQIPVQRATVQLPAPTPDLTLIDGWRASSITGLSNGASVSSWPSFNPNSGQALAQSTGGKQPTYSTSVGGRIAVTFSGSQWMETASNVTLPQDGRFTVYARIHWSTLPVSNQTVVAMDINSSGSRDWHLKGITGAIAQAANFVGTTGATDNAPGSLVAGNWHLLTLRCDETNGLECLSDGFSNGSSTLRANVNISAVPLHVGCSITATPSEPLTGDVAEVRIYSGRHNDLQVAIVAASM